MTEPRDLTTAESSSPTAAPLETRRDRAGRYAQRTKLYTWAAVLVVVLVMLVILIAQNTRSVKVGWVFGHSHISLVFLVVFATILGWLLGIATSIVFRRRTRRPTV